MSTRAERLAAFSAERLLYLRGLKSPSDAQRLILLLAEKTDRSPADEKRLAALWDAEFATAKAAEAIAQAKRQAAAIVGEEKERERKARNHRLIQLGALLEIAGIDTQDRGALLGAFLGLANVTDSTKWASWKQTGDAELAKRETKAKT